VLRLVEKGCESRSGHVRDGPPAWAGIGGGQAVGPGNAVSPPPADWDAARVRSFLEEYNRHMLQILTIHEAYPGHYVQLEYSNRSRSLIRRVLQSGVFAEGWAVYTEQRLLDQG